MNFQIVKFRFPHNKAELSHSDNHLFMFVFPCHFHNKRRPFVSSDLVRFAFHLSTMYLLFFICD